MLRFSTVALVVLGAVLFAAGPLGGQADPRSSQTEPPPSPLEAMENDIKVKKEALYNESIDLDELLRGLTGVEYNATSSLDQYASQGVMELDATLWFLRLYEVMRCEPDRDLAKTALKNRLGFYSNLLGLHADAANHQLLYTRLPATAQAGQRIKDDLRAAKNKLDEVAASLN